MNCRRARDATSLYADGLLPEFERRLLERHLVGCEPCQSLAVSVLAATALRRFGLPEGMVAPAATGPPSSSEAGDIAMTAQPDPGAEGPPEAPVEPRVAALLAAAERYEVLSADGRRLGVVDHVRYRSRLDHPDEIVVASGHLAWRRFRVLPVDALAAIDPAEGTIFLRIAAAQARQLPVAGRSRRRRLRF